MQIVATQQHKRINITTNITLIDSAHLALFAHFTPICLFAKMSALRLTAKDYSIKLTDDELAQHIHLSLWFPYPGHDDHRIPVLSNNGQNWTYDSQETFRSAVQSLIQVANQSGDDLFAQLDFVRIAGLCSNLYVINTFQHAASIRIMFHNVMLCQLTNTQLVGKEHGVTRVEFDVAKVWTNARVYVNSKPGVDWFAVAKYAGITWSVMFAAGLSLCALAHVTKPK